MDHSWGRDGGVIVEDICLREETVLAFRAPQQIDIRLVEPVCSKSN